MHWSRRFFIIAFILLLEGAAYHVVQHVTKQKYDFVTSIDNAIPLLPGFVWVYHTLIPGIVLAHIFFIRKKRVFYSSIISFTIAVIVLKSCFLLFPAACPRVELDPASMSEWLLSWTYNIDATNNTFPSTHITFACLAFLNVWRSSFSCNIKAVLSYGIWAILILVSTLVIKQHFIFDVISGMLLAMLAAWTSYKIYDGIINVTNDSETTENKQYENC